MNRRSMLGMLGIGSVAAPEVVKQMAYDSPVNPVPSTGMYGASQGIWDVASKETNYLQKAREELDLINADPAKWIAERVAQEMNDYLQGYAAVSFNQIDPDIRNMKSVTEKTKMRMYYERRAKRRYEERKQSLSMQLMEGLGIMK